MFTTVSTFLTTNWLGQAILILLECLAVTVPLLVAVAYMTYVDRKVWASIQLRRGPPVGPQRGVVRDLDRRDGGLRLRGGGLGDGRAAGRRACGRGRLRSIDIEIARGVRQGGVELSHLRRARRVELRQLPLERVLRTSQAVGRGQRLRVRQFRDVLDVGFRVVQVRDIECGHAPSFLS